MTRSLVEDVWPLSPLQEGMLFHAAFDNEGPDVYTVQSALDIGGPVNAARFRASWQALAARHAALRACFRQVSGGQMVQVIAREVKLPWTEADVSELTEPEAAAEVERLAAGELAVRFDLAVAPLLRLLFIRLGENRHRLVMTFHHVLMDGWSMPVLLSELSTIYAADGDASRLRRAPSYGQYMAWLSRQDKEEARSAWRTELSGADEPTLVAPADPTRAPAFPAHVFGELPEDTTRALSDLARSQGLTMNTVVQGAWALVLARLAGRDDVVFGATVAGRPAELPGVESMVGLLINTLPVRVELDGTQSMLQTLERLQERQTGLMSYQYMGLSEIQKLSGPGAVFDSLVLYESFPAPPAAPAVPDAVSIRPSGMSRDASHYPITLVVTPGPRLRFKLDYRPDLFDRATAESVFRRVMRVLEQVVADPLVAVGRVDVVGEVERELVVGGFNDTGRPVAGGSLLELFGSHVRASPGVVAVRSGSEVLSYAELDERSDRLARFLVSVGVGREGVVGLCLPRGVDVVVGELAVWKAGGAFVPLDPEYPSDRLRYMVGNSGAGVVLATAETLARVPAGPARVVLLEEVPAAPDPVVLPGVTDPDQLAYVIYTSGSTGRPKGVAVGHRGVVNLVGAMAPVLGAGPGVVTLQFASFSFDAAILDVAVVLGSGGTLAIAMGEERAEPGALAGMIAAHGVTTASVVPSLLGVLNPEQVSGVKTWVLGAERLTADLAARWVPGAKVVNTYGPTEATVMVTAGPVDARIASADEAPVIGRPLSNSRIYVLDSFLRPVPPGITGEVYVAGAGLARGYVARPDLTSERFVACPFVTGERMYRSGDLARWNGEGELAFVGRADAQVKVRGFRIELGEIEAILSAHPAVGQAVVVAREDGPGDKQLVGYVVPRTQDIDMRQVREHLAEALPEYMVPAALLVLDALPLTPNGKVDRGALPAPDFAGRVSDRTPVGETEEKLCALFAEVLELERVGVDDNFFDLGGDSGLAMRLAARIREELGADLSMRQFFGASTPVGVARMLAAKARPELGPAERSEEMPVSVEQQRTWLMSGLAEESRAAHRSSIALRLSGSLDRAALEAALGDVAVRHEILRTRFTGERADDLRQHVLDADDPAARPALSVTSATSAGEEELAGLLADRSGREFDLARQLPWRADLFALSDTEHVLLLVVHRIAGDDASLDIVVRDLAAAYGARREGRKPERAPLSLQFADYALWEGELLRGTEESDSLISDQLTYWKERLADLEPELPLPFDRPRPVLADHRTGSVPLSLDADAHDRLADAAEAEDAPVFVAVQAALALLLTRLGAGDDVVLGTRLSRRFEEGDLEGVVGPLTHPLVLRTDTSGDPTYRELLRRAQEVNQEALRHRDMPFERLVDVLRHPASAARHPVFQVLLEVGDLSVEELDAADLPGLRTTRLDGVSGDTELDLWFALNERTHGDGTPNGIEGVLRYATELFDASTATALAGRLVRVLEQVAAEPELRVSEVDVLLGEEERRQLLGGGLDPADDLVHDTDPVHGPTPLRDTLLGHDTVLGLLADQVARTPDALAVKGQDGSLTYRALDSVTDLLARRLSRRGAGTEQRVIVMLPPGAGFTVALIGVLKAGGVCSFVDPTRPFVGGSDGPGPRSRPAALVCTAAMAGRMNADSRIPVLWIDDLLEEDAEFAPAATPTAAAPPQSRPAQAAVVLDALGADESAPGSVVDHRALLRQTAHRLRTVAVNGAPALLDARAPVGAFLVPLLASLGAGGGVRFVVPGEDAVALATAAEPAETTLVTTRDRLRKIIGSEAGHRPFAEVTVVESGRPVGAAETREWQELHPDTSLISSVTAVGTAGPWLEHRLSPGDPAPVRLPAGRPVHGSRALVLDDLLRPVPPGVVGDVYVTGTPLSRGIAGGSSLTAERFVALPYGGPGERMLRTGERARRTPAGLLALRDPGEERDRGSRARRTVTDSRELEVLLPLRASGGRPPLFCLHETTGLSWIYAALLQYLPQDLPVYGVQARGLTGAEPPADGIEEMAADYAEQIRSVQPTGPYHLLGWSLGGVLAHAVATRLEELGEEVALLAVLDAYPQHGVGTSLYTYDDEETPEGRDSGRRMQRGPGGQDITGVSGPALENVKKVIQNTAGFMPDYTPRHFRGDLLVFVATVDRPQDRPVSEAVATWDPYVSGNVESHEIATRHKEMLKPTPAAHIGRVLTEKLGAARNGSE
ncbi:amino acid adenylation domain-containing protein [Streptomyces sp. NBC_01317]|uniref:non-ribosomal peptide synthetase n=1 Tax=Streptomyces sp. NBC_01317 TaxID=2903822 RepID=UPI002E0EF671|nr:non-ribosomal peptide synthetase [Streptomyces sp. NBC_01317]WSJ47242.1 amino acid adenylation domain-containing protein [Streptomyces sp. NBC_01317]